MPVRDDVVMTSLLQTKHRPRTEERRREWMSEHGVPACEVRSEREIRLRSHCLDA